MQKPVLLNFLKLLEETENEQHKQFLCGVLIETLNAALFIENIGICSTFAPNL
jgi:hypothetical protein